MAIQGQDWASYQSATPSTAGLAFTFIKATEGTSYVSPHMASQTAHARAGGLVVGFYHFLRPGSMTAQAAYFVAQAAIQDGDILAADWEDPGVSCAQKDQFIREVKRLRPTHRVVLYCNTSYWKDRDTTSYTGDGLWIADPNHPSGSPGIIAGWLFQQYSSAGGVDRNVGNFADKAALRAWAAEGTKPPAPKPVIKPKYEPFPGASWFTTGRKSPIVAAMHARLVAVGCSRYQSSTHRDVIGPGDKASYEAWQRKCGHTGAAAKWPPGKSTWDLLRVPNV